MPKTSGNKKYEIVTLGDRKFCLFGEKYKIYQVIRERKMIKTSQLRELTDVKYNSIRGALITLTHDGLIVRTEKGNYKLTEPEQ
jgi:predicted transcriptional regulator of viral defense system